MPVVIIRRMGGLGNQLFQYAAARAVAYHHPDSQIYVGPETENAHNYQHYDYASIFMRHATPLCDVGAFAAHEFQQEGSFVPWQPETVRPPVRLSGYFQYYPALRPILQDLVVEFQTGLVPYLLPIGREDQCVFLHVRRGDYLRLPDYHYIQTKTYYENAFQLWRKNYHGDDFQVYIISDDPVWCQQQDWTFPYKLHHDPDEVRTLALMSQCKAGAIIGNSSYSYWGAMLSQTQHVFYPERWIAETVHDLFPSNWVCVKG